MITSKNRFDDVLLQLWKQPRHFLLMENEK